VDYLLQTIVARQMAIGIVVRFEEIDIEKDE